MISTHVYSAAVIGSPDVPLRMKNGSVDLDDTRAPHVQATVSVAIPAQAILALLDPRLGRRVRVTVQAQYPSGPQTRTFDLGIRDMEVRHLAGEVSLSLASDEAILADYAPLATDTGTYAYQDSVRGLTNYVLGLALPGATVAAPAPDAPIRALMSSVNLLRNSRAKSDLSGWSSSGDVSIARDTSGGPSGSPTFVVAQRASAGSLLVQYAQDVPLAAGKRYRLTVAQNVAAGTATAIDAVLTDSSGNVLVDLPETSVVAGAGWFRRTNEFIAPSGVKQVAVRSFTTVSVTAGASLNTTALRLSEVTDDPTDIGYFDGDTPSTSEYAYAYAGSTSTRTALIDRAANLLTWPAGVSALEFLMPLVQSLGMRLVCDETRTWTLRRADYEAAGSLSIRHGVNLIDGSEGIKRDEGLWFDAQVTRYRWNDAQGISQERLDTYALTATPVRVNRVDIDAPYPGPGRSKYAVQRAQGQGRTLTLTSVADWRTQAEQWSEFYLLSSPVQTGKTSRVVFDLDRDRMTVTSRTADTPASAWVLIPTGQKWTDSPVGGSWIGEVV